MSAVRPPTERPTHLSAGSAAVCPGHVRHDRAGATSHSFEQPLAMVWLDPDDPAELFDRHPLWSDRHMAPIRFRRSDHGDPDDRRSPGDAVRDDLADVLGVRPAGPVRLLTQPRIWGWSFNPISISLAWDDPATDPVGAVAEVTNTPWHERHRYAVALTRATDDGHRLTATFDKRLHVSPFLPAEGRYELAMEERGEMLGAEIRFTPADAPASQVTSLTAHLEIQRVRPTRRAMSRMLFSPWLPTHRVTAAIRRHAYSLWRGGAPVHAHPHRRRR